jgi:membrane protease YdiL (CAAX protease family)
MRSLARFVLFVAGCAWFAAAASPALCLGARWLADRTSWEVASYLAGHPFHRYFNRCLQAALLLGVWPLLKGTGFGSARALGLRGPGFARGVALGLATGVGALALYVALLLALGGARLRDTPPFERLGGILAGVALTAAVVSVLEEAFFRGYMFQLFRREAGRGLAYAAQVLVFPPIHFLKPADASALGPVDAWSGFRMLGAAFGHLGQFPAVAGGLAVLAAIAWMLCRALEREGNLGLPIGMHAGWIVALQLASQFLQPGTAVAGWPNWILGGGNLSHGALAVAPLAAQALALGLFRARRAG